MSLADCEKCWDTPCTCGWGFKDYPDEYLSKVITSMLSYKPNKTEIIEMAIINLTT